MTGPLKFEDFFHFVCVYETRENYWEFDNKRDVNSFLTESYAKP